jgi:hypothetical protein
MPDLRRIHSGWTVRAVSTVGYGDAVAGPVPASVPGCVHTDLLAGGLIHDPYLDDNETGTTWIGRTDWLYQTTFDAEELGADRIQLVAHGLDTVATVTLNGVELGRTANMHRAYRYDVAALLRATGNELSVRFDSAYRYAERVRDRLGARPNAYDEPFQYIRKMASNFGWPATSAGTGDPPSSRPASGSRSDSKPGRRRVWRRSARSSRSTAATVTSTCTSPSSGPPTLRCGSARRSPAGPPR